MEWETKEKVFFGVPFRAWVFLFFLLPLVTLIVISFFKFQNYQIVPAFTLSNYAEVFSSEFYLKSLGNSVWLAIGASSLVILLAYPFSFYVSFFIKEKYQNFLLMLTVLPLFTNFILRAFAWRIFFSEKGLLNKAITSMGIVGSSQDFLFNPFIIIFGISTYLLPFAIFIFYSSISNISREKLKAAEDLGAKNKSLFSRIVLPASKNSIILVFIISFIVSMGDFIIVTLMGGSSVYTMSLQILDVLQVNNIPLAAAMGVVLLLIFVIPLIIAIYLQREDNKDV